MDAQLKILGAQTIFMRHIRTLCTLYALTVQCLKNYHLYHIHPIYFKNISEAALFLYREGADDPLDDSGTVQQQLDQVWKFYCTRCFS